jgi:predicted HTH transcriptional regulator
MSWSEHSTRGKVLKAALAMANKRDGGILAFGLNKASNQPLYDMVGMKKVEYDSFEQDSVASFVNSHAAPHVDLTVEHLTIDGRLFVAILIREFSDYPIICSKALVIDNKQVVGRGKFYCRSRRMPESTEVQTPEDMRDVLNLAADKALERYFRMREIERKFEGPEAAERFAGQLKDLQP